MVTFKDIQARLELLSSVVVSGEYNYTYTFDNASAKIFNNFAKNIVKEIPSFKDVFEEYADGFEDCRFRVEVDYEEYGVFVGIVFISSEDDFCELVYDELEDTKEFLVNSYNGELSFEVRI